MADISEVKAGDTLAVRGRHGDSLEEVIRITNTQVICKYGRFRRKDGALVGRDAWTWATARIANAEDLEKIGSAQRKNAITARLRGEKWNELPLERLEAIAAILDSGDDSFMGIRLKIDDSLPPNTAVLRYDKKHGHPLDQ